MTNRKLKAMLTEAYNLGTNTTLSKAGAEKELNKIINYNEEV